MTDASDASDDCVTLGNKILAPCEAAAVDHLIDLMLTSPAATYLPTWQRANVVKSSMFRMMLSGRMPWRALPGRPKSDRITEVMMILTENAILTPMSAREAYDELDEIPRAGSFCRVGNRELLRGWLGSFVSEVEGDPDPMDRVTGAISADGRTMEEWKPHPTAPGWWYRGQEVIRESEVAERLKRVVGASTGA